MPDRRLWTGIDVVLFVGFWANAIRQDFALWAVAFAVAWSVRVVVGVVARARQEREEQLEDAPPARLP